MNSAIPTHVGDVLILLTDESFHVHAVGQVTNEGQQDFDTYDRGQPEYDHPYGQLHLKYEIEPAAAIAEAIAMVAPGRRIFFRNIDTGDWSEISSRPS